MKEITNNPPPRRFAFVAPAVLLLLFLSAGITATYAQDENATEAQTPESAAGRVNNVADLLRVLNLTPEQRAQIAAIRRETNQQGRSLVVRLRQARRALDEALYADNPDDKLVEDRVREVGAAQTAVMRMRTFAELKIRRVLSPEQLNAFRRLQRQGRAGGGGGGGQRMNQTSPPGNSPEATRPERLRNRVLRRRQLEQQQQQLQQPLSNNPQTPSPSAPRERRRTRLRDRKP